MYIKSLVEGEAASRCIFWFFLIKKFLWELCCKAKLRTSNLSWRGKLDQGACSVFFLTKNNLWESFVGQSHEHRISREGRGFIMMHALTSLDLVLVYLLNQVTSFTFITISSPYEGPFWDTVSEHLFIYTYTYIYRVHIYSALSSNVELYVGNVLGRWRWRITFAGPSHNRVKATALWVSMTRCALFFFYWLFCLVWMSRTSCMQGWSLGFTERFFV